MTINNALAMDDYRADPAWSASDLKAFRLGPPAMVPWSREHPRENSDTMKLGTACHAAILEGDAVAERYAFKPEDMSFATKEGKEWKAAHQGKIILTAKEADIVTGVVEAFEGKELARAALEQALGKEASVFWTNDAGVKLKARPDFYTADAVYDLKVSRHAAANQIMWRSYGDGWCHQLAHYREGLRANGVAIKHGRLIVIHPKPPHVVYCVEIKPDALDLLALENAATIAAMAKFATNDVWPWTPDEWTLTDLPPTALAAAVFSDGDPE